MADWFPTLARLVGFEPGADLAWDGLDRWDAIAGAADAAPRPKPVCIVHQTGRAVVGDRWKLIARRQGPAMLFDLAADPFETTNLAEKHADVVAAHLAIAEADAAMDLTDLPADLADTPP